MSSQARTKPVTRGVHHLGLTVPSLDETNHFFKSILGFEQIGEVPDYPAVFLSDGAIMLTLWQAENPDTAIAFDRKNVIGLHHFALGVDNHAALDSLYEDLKTAAGVTIEFAPEPLGTGPVRHMMTCVPGGIRVEFISPSE